MKLLSLTTTIYILGLDNVIAQHRYSNENDSVKLSALRSGKETLSLSSSFDVRTTEGRKNIRRLKKGKHHHHSSPSHHHHHRHDDDWNYPSHRSKYGEGKGGKGRYNDDWSDDWHHPTTKGKGKGKHHNKHDDDDWYPVGKRGKGKGKSKYDKYDDDWSGKGKGKKHHGKGKGKKHHGKGKGKKHHGKGKGKNHHGKKHHGKKHYQSKGKGKGKRTRFYHFDDKISNDDWGQKDVCPSISCGDNDSIFNVQVSNLVNAGKVSWKLVDITSFYEPIVIPGITAVAQKEEQPWDDLVANKKKRETPTEIVVLENQYSPRDSNKEFCNSYCIAIEKIFRIDVFVKDDKDDWTVDDDWQPQRRKMQEQGIQFKQKGEVIYVTSGTQTGQSGAFGGFICNPEGEFCGTASSDTNQRAVKSGECRAANRVCCWDEGQPFGHGICRSAANCARRYGCVPEDDLIPITNDENDN